MRIFSEDYNVKVVWKGVQSGGSTKKACFCGEEFWQVRFKKHIVEVHPIEYGESVAKVSASLASFQ